MIGSTMRQRLLKGFGANVYGQAVTVVVQLVGVPVLLHAWGSQAYGQWLVLSAIPTYLAMTDFGFSQSAANDMSSSIARNDRAEALAVFKTLRALVFSVSALMLCLVYLLLLFLPLDHWVHNDADAIPSDQLRWVLWFLAADVLLRLSEGVSHAALRANRDYALHAFIYASTVLLQSLAVWVVASLGYGLFVAAGAMFAIRCLLLPAVAAVAVWRHPWLRDTVAPPYRSELRRLAKPALASISLPLAQALNIQGMILVVGAVLGPSAVVIFSTLRTLTRMAHQMVMIVGKAAEPELAASHGISDGSLMKYIFMQSMRASLWFAIGAAALLYVFGGDIVHIWTHGAVQLDPGLFNWLLLSGVISAFWYSFLFVRIAANQHLMPTLVYSLGAAMALALASVLLILTNRLSSAGLALLTIDVAMMIYTFRALPAVMGASARHVIGQALNPLPLLKLIRAERYVL